MEHFHSLVEWANPSPQDRLPLDLSNLHILALPYPVVLLQIHLLFRHPLNPLNRFVRILLIFPAVVLSSRAGFGHRFKLDDEVGGTLQCYNVALGVYVAVIIAKSIEWGLLNERPRLRHWKKNERDTSKTESDNHSIINGGHRFTNGEGRSSTTSSIRSHSRSRSIVTARSSPNSSRYAAVKSKEASSLPPEALPLFFPGTWVPLELDYLASMRGLGWEFGIDSPAGSGRKWSLKERWTFILKRIGNALAGILLMDLLDNLMKHPKINPSSRLGGGSLWESREGVLGNFGPPALTMLLGFVVYAAIQGFYSLLSVIFVALGSSPDYWTPLPFNRPWAASSLRKLWSKHWHALFRRSFLYLAYFPTRNLTKSKALAVLSTFILSGVLHETGNWSMIRPPPFDQDRMWGRTGLFFFFQGVGTLLEEYWELRTGGKVRGWLGWIWTYGWMTLTGMMASDVWFRLGMASSHASLRQQRPLVEMLVEMLERWK